MMKRALIFAAVLLLAVSGAASAASFTMNVFPSLAPNYSSGSPSLTGYTTNALTWLEAESGPFGNPSTDPTAYKQVSTMGPGDNLVTSFNSWQGVASPGAPFAGEFGNRLHFGVHILRTDATFTLSGLDFHVHSTEPGDSLHFSGFPFTAADVYSTRRVGIYYGPDGDKSTLGDNVVRTSGFATLPVNELMYVGVGNAWWPQVPDDGPTGQAAIDSVAAWIGSQAPFSVIGTYSLYLNDSFLPGDLLISNSATVDVVTPEPTTLLLWGTTALGLAAVRRWRNRREV